MEVKMYKIISKENEYDSIKFKTVVKKQDLEKTFTGKFKVYLALDEADFDERELPQAISDSKKNISDYEKYVIINVLNNPHFKDDFTEFKNLLFTCSAQQLFLYLDTEEFNVKYIGTQQSLLSNEFCLIFKQIGSYHVEENIWKL